MNKKFLTMCELLCMIQHGTQPDTIYIKNDNGTDTEAHWVIVAKEYMTKDGNSLWFKLRKETIFLSRTFYYYDEVLDEAEKKYLHGIIAPFRNRITRIVKARYSFDHDSYRIYIYYKEKGDPPSIKYFMALPSFKCSTKMYEKMEEGRSYTLEELGL